MAPTLRSGNRKPNSREKRPAPPAGPDALLAPLKARSLKDEFASRFEELILSGRFGPGDKLPPERELAESLRVSRPVVHEGIVDLAAKGLVRIVPRHGAYVSDYRREGSVELLVSLFNFTYGDQKLTLRLLDSLLEVRILFETETARLAALRRTAEQLAELESIVEREEDMHTLPAEEIARIDFDFHHTVALCTQNDVYPLLINSFRRMYLSVLELFYRNPGVVGPVVGYHKVLLEKIAARDAPGAQETMAAVLHFGEKKLRAALSRSRGTR
ncbi:MAG: FadR/GntR family transcriptional regulator [Myxococcales bacterium]|jgi:GntR family transcriptional repressor for pyruvate dehydrogenase complex